MGACLSDCPQGALAITEVEIEEYGEEEVIAQEASRISSKVIPCESVMTGINGEILKGWEAEVLDKCPGSGNIRVPTPFLKECPGCGEEVEIWSDELKAECTRCGNIVFKENAPSCVEWCQYAKECVGEEKYNRLMEGKAKPE